jgi:hypothetical protein
MSASMTDEERLDAAEEQIFLDLAVEYLGAWEVETLWAYRGRGQPAEVLTATHDEMVDLGRRLGRNDESAYSDWRAALAARPVPENG